MIAMLCRNRVADFAKWKAVFDSHAQAQRAAGFHLKSLWRELNQPDNVFFLFEVEDVAKARAFITSPAATAIGKASGVVEGEYHFLESTR
jgi:hypothetical protein